MSTQQVPKGGPCAACIHCDEWECRRFPPILLKAGEFVDGHYSPPDFGFPHSGTRCGEFKEAEADE